MVDVHERAQLRNEPGRPERPSAAARRSRGTRPAARTRCRRGSRLPTSLIIARRSQDASCCGSTAARPLCRSSAGRSTRRARSGRFGVRVSLYEPLPGHDVGAVTGATESRGRRTRLWRRSLDPAAPSRSVTSMPTNEQADVALGPRDEDRRAEVLGRQIDDPSGPGRITLPPPSSSATSAV